MLLCYVVVLSVDDVVDCVNIVNIGYIVSIVNIVNIVNMHVGATPAVLPVIEFPAPVLPTIVRPDPLT